MKQKNISAFVIFIWLLYACDNDPAPGIHVSASSADKASEKINYASRESYSGISLVNDPIRGYGFTDSTGKTKLFIRWIKVQLINDTLMPVNLQLYFSKKNYYFLHSPNEKFKLLLLQKPESNFGKPLNLFLKEELQRPSSIIKIIKPGETFVMNIGMFFSEPAVGIITAELFFKGQKKSYVTDTLVSLKNLPANGLDILLDVSVSSHQTYYSTVSCGKITFLN